MKGEDEKTKQMLNSIGMKKMCDLNQNDRNECKEGQFKKKMGQ